MSTEIKPRYLDQVDALAETLPPGHHHLYVMHDSWCDLLNEVGDCNCEPDVAVAEPEEDRKIS
jgi:hypothetical protein